MLRINEVNDGALGRTLRLEGKLLEPWVAELRQACLRNGERLTAVRLDLAAVSFVDAAGAELLRDLVGQGVVLAPCSRYIVALLHVESQ